jgi:chromosomal replication initiation ATPase DnaA
MTVWDEILDHIKPTMPAEDFRRWFGATAYASDAGDQITVWVPSEAIRRHITTHFQDRLDRALAAVGRTGTHLRLVIGAMEDDDE